MVKIKTNLGEIHIEMDMENTPETAKNFLQYAKDGFYNGTLFHRVIDNFMVQGGAFEPGMRQKIANDAILNEADQCHPNKRGTIAMARTIDPHSATAQFFINVADNDFLDHRAKNTKGWGYCTFGKVVEGMDVVDKIKALKTVSKAGHEDVPEEDVLIEEIVVEE